MDVRDTQGAETVNDLLGHVDPPLEALLRVLRSYGASGEPLIPELLARYGKHWEPPYWRFFFDEPAKGLGDVPADARRVVISARAEGFGRIREFAQLEAVSVSDFGPDVAGILAGLPKLRCLALWGGPLKDLTCLGLLPSLEHLIVFGAVRLHSLEGLNQLQNLKTLRLEGIPKVTRLDPIAALTQLQGLELRAGLVCGTFADRTKFESLSPLRALASLKVLRLWATRVKDDDLAPVASLGKLEDIEIPPRTFPVKAMAVVAAAYPQLQEQWLRPLGAVMPCRECGEAKVMVIGRGSRDICARCHPDRLERFFERFRACVDSVKDNNEEGRSFLSEA